jgi:hypothetical protein
MQGGSGCGKCAERSLESIAGKISALRVAGRRKPPAEPARRNLCAQQSRQARLKAVFHGIAMSSANARIVSTSC